MAGNERSAEKRSEKRRSEQRERRVSRVQGLQFLVGGSGGNTPCKSKKSSEYWLTHSETSNADYDGIMSECVLTFREHSEMPFEPVIEALNFFYL